MCQIYRYIQFLSTLYEQKYHEMMLTMQINGHMRHFDKNRASAQKYANFDLKVALFVEKRKNKFAHEYKKNKFVFN